MTTTKVTQTDTDEAPKEIADLMRVTGLGRLSCMAGILSGELPGYKVGRRYKIPAAAFDDFCHGRWVPKPRPIFAKPVKPLTLTEIHRRVEKVG